MKCFLVFYLVGVSPLKGTYQMELLLILLPAFLIFGTGYAGQKLLKLNIKSISTMALYLMAPFLAFETFYINKLNSDYFFIFSFSVILSLCLIAITVIFGKIIKADKAHMSVLLLGSIFPNSGNYGAPVVLFAFGQVAFEYAVIIMVIHSFLINSIGIFIASYGSKKSTTLKNALHNVFKMPVLYGALLGIFFQLCNINIPTNIIEGISLIGAASIPTVMLILGMQLAEIKPQKFGIKYISIIMLIRMLISPVIAALLIWSLPVSDTIKQVFILLGAMPVAANTTMLAVQFDVESDLISFATLVTTLFSLITIPITLYLLNTM
jgi:malate permease and related proteins